LDDLVVAEGSKLARRPTFVIQPTKGLTGISIRELWSFRDLIIILAGRDVKLRYKQTALGVVWVIMQPVIASLIFAVIFGLFAKLPSDGSPYLLFAFCGMLAWGLFSAAVQRGGASLVENASLVSKTYFPRIIIPLSSTLSALIDFCVSLAIMIVFMLVYQVTPTWRLVTLPLFVFLAMLAAAGASLWLTALNVYYRDFMYALPFILQVWMYATPVAYATSMIPEAYRVWFSLNPMVGIVEGFRWALLGESSVTVSMLVASTLVSGFVFIGGLIFFRRFERGFADTI